SGDVIDVSMREQDRRGCQFAGAQRLDNLLRLKPRIDHETVVPSGTADNQRVLHVRRGNEDIDLERHGRLSNRDFPNRRGSSRIRATKRIAQCLPRSATAESAASSMHRPEMSQTKVSLKDPS